MMLMGKIAGRSRCSERGFTLIELLIVVAILGLLAAVAVPNVGRFISWGQEESYNTELYNIRVGTLALLADSNNKLLDASYMDPTNDMSTITADNGSSSLDMYLSGLNGTLVASDCQYTFTQDGEVVTQITP